MLHLLYFNELSAGRKGGRERKLIKTRGPLLSGGMVKYCTSSLTLQIESQSPQSISSADIATGLLLSVVRTSENPLAAAKVLLTHAAKFHTVNTYTGLIINKPHPLFPHSFSINAIQWNCGRRPHAAVMESLLKGEGKKNSPEVVVFFLVGFLFWRMNQKKIS